MRNEKAVWIKADGGNWDDNKTLITTGLESGADCVLLNAADVARAKELGNIRVAAPGNEADIVVVGIGSEGDGTKPLPSELSDSEDIAKANQLVRDGKTVAGFVVIKNKKYEEFALELGSSCDHLMVIGTDWKVIPLENLIAGL